MIQEPRGGPPTAQDRLARRMGPSAVTGAAFFAQPAADLATLAAQQGVRPLTKFEDLLIDIWPEHEDIDAFIATLRRWRHEDATIFDERYARQVMATALIVVGTQAVVSMAVATLHPLLP